MALIFLRHTIRVLYDGVLWDSGILAHLVDRGEERIWIPEEITDIQETVARTGAPFCIDFFELFSISIISMGIILTYRFIFVIYVSLFPYTTAFVYTPYHTPYHSFPSAVTATKDYKDCNRSRGPLAIILHFHSPTTFCV
jgi:hypothetical protein